jgi:hypothetical protein
MNIASHNARQEFVFPIRSSTMENTCFGTFLTHDDFTGSFQPVGEPEGSLEASIRKEETSDEYEQADVGCLCSGLRHGCRGHCRHACGTRTCTLECHHRASDCASRRHSQCATVAEAVVAPGVVRRSLGPPPRRGLTNRPITAMLGRALARPLCTWALSLRA